VKLAREQTAEVTATTAAAATARSADGHHDSPSMHQHTDDDDEATTTGHTEPHAPAVSCCYCTVFHKKDPFLFFFHNSLK